MEIICYCSKDGHVPLYRYLEKYIPLEQDSEILVEKKLRSYKKIKAVISHTAENNGLPGGDYSSPLKGGYSFQEIKIKDSNNLIRVLYFCHYEERLVLLNGFDKPDKYEKRRKLKVDKKIKEEYEKAQQYYEDYINNPNQYEKYE